MAYLYRAFARAMEADLPFEADFDHGIMRHRLLETIERAADCGERMNFGPGQ